MKYPYYPGCSLYDTAAVFNDSALKVAQKLDIELVELEEWQCCGAVYPLSSDGLFPLAAPLRNLVQAERMVEAGKSGVYGESGEVGEAVKSEESEDPGDSGEPGGSGGSGETGGTGGAGEVSNKMVTLCSACYNVHKRVDHLVREDEETLERINSYNREDEYHKGVEIVHLLDVLRDDVGFERLKEAVTRDLQDLKVGAYYGCLLLRPEEALNFDDPEDPAVFEDLLTSLGCEPVKFPHRAECCGAYATVHLESPPESAARAIIESAVGRGARLLVTSCPLCHYNLEESQQNILEREPGFQELPVIYFTELLEYALGLSAELAGLDLRVK